VQRWKLAIPVLAVAAVAMVPQGPATTTDPALVDQVLVVPISELQYVSPQGNATVVSGRNIVEIRLVEDVPQGIRLELLYENGDYGLVDAQSFHILRNAGSTREVRLVRGSKARMRFPKLP
jgi:hypothetical protein